MNRDFFQSYPGLSLDVGQTAVEKNLEALRRDGYFIIDNVFDSGECETISKRMDVVWELQVSKYGEEFLRKIGDFGQIRAMMDTDPYFLDLIRRDSYFSYVKEVIGETAILHLQNGIVLHPGKKHNQARFHKDFPKDFVSSKPLSLNVLIAIDEFNPETGGTWIVPGTHREERMPSQHYLEQNAIQATVPRGGAIIFDSFLWHRGGDNLASVPRRAINQQYTRAFIKQQLNYPELLRGKVDVNSEVAQTLGLWSVSPRSVDEFRVSDPAFRTYRAGQG